MVECSVHKEIDEEQEVEIEGMISILIISLLYSLYNRYRGGKE